MGEGDQLAKAVREVASGGSMLDPKIVEALTTPISEDAALNAVEEDLLRQVAEGQANQSDRGDSQNHPRAH